MRLADGTEIDLTAHGSEKDFPAFRKEGVLKYLLGKLVEGKEYTFISELKRRLNGSRRALLSPGR